MFLIFLPLVLRSMSGFIYFFIFFASLLCYLFQWLVFFFSLLGLWFDFFHFSYAFDIFKCLIILNIISWSQTDHHYGSNCIVRWDFSLLLIMECFLFEFIYWIVNSSSVTFYAWELYVAKFKHVSSRVVLNFCARLSKGP